MVDVFRSILSVAELIKLSRTAERLAIVLEESGQTTNTHDR